MAEKVNVITTLSEQELKHKLREMVERIEDAEADAREAKDIVKGLYTEAKSFGFNKKALKSVIKLRRMEKMARQELEFEMERYTSIIEGTDNGDIGQD